MIFMKRKRKIPMMIFMKRKINQWNRNIPKYYGKVKLANNESGIPSALEIIEQSAITWPYITLTRTI